MRFRRSVPNRGWLAVIKEPPDNTLCEAQFEHHLHRRAWNRERTEPFIIRVPDPHAFLQAQLFRCARIVFPDANASRDEASRASRISEAEVPQFNKHETLDLEFLGQRR